jgi:hypothetical protein
MNADKNINREATTFSKTYARLLLGLGNDDDV